tara:strand:+ start:456 stop:1091 length:636 start_codon:yes stop_codon:yes gene_type:complete
MSAQKIISSLISINSIKINLKNPYVWASGWKSPIYCDNRISLSYPKIRDNITAQLVNKITSSFNKIDAIAGVATAGIPQASLVAKELNLPLVYVRSNAKKHGMKNMIEGDLKNNSNVLVIEDLISTGGSSLKAIDAIKERKCNVLGLVCIFNYSFEISKTNFKSNSIKVISLCNYYDLIEFVKTKKIISSKEIEFLENWRKNPDKWTNYSS